MKKLQKRGKSTFQAEVCHISLNGLWILVEDREYFLPFEDYPWFREAKISDIHELECLGDRHLHWPKLDVDLELDSLKNPEKYPLIYK